MRQDEECLEAKKYVMCHLQSKCDMSFILFRQLTGGLPPPPLPPMFYRMVGYKDWLSFIGLFSKKAPCSSLPLVYHRYHDRLFPGTIWIPVLHFLKQLESAVQRGLAKAGLKFKILLPWFPKCWDYEVMPPYLALHKISEVFWNLTC